MSRVAYILATAGHVDHGKSALVRALTGTDPDRLPEEKARGMTIDLGFAHLVVPSPLGVSPAAEYDIGIIDVPGHEDFIRNMVAGVGCVDLALFVIAANEGWMPQTEEHLQILSYLGITRGIVVLTKSDLPHDDGALRAQIATNVNSTFLEHAPVVETSVTTGEGLDKLKATIANILAQTPPREDLGLPRAPVDRVFTIKGVGTVVTGTLSGGSLTRGQSVLVQSATNLLPARVRAIQSHHRDVAAAAPGSRVALNLPDLHSAGADHQRTICRGDVVTIDGVGVPSNTLDVQIGSMPRGPSAVPQLTSVQVHLGSICVPGRCILLDAQMLHPGETALAQLRLKQPLLALAGDRVLIRDASGRRTLAGAVVLDALATRRRIRDAARLSRLRSRARYAGHAKLWIETELEQKRLIPAGRLPQTSFSATAIETAARELVDAGKAVALGGFWASAHYWSELLAQSISAIDEFHQRHPEQPGLPLPDLLRHVGPGTPASCSTALVDTLCRDGFTRQETVIRRKDHRPALPPRLQAAGSRLRAQLAETGLDAPSTKQLAPDPVSQQALRFLIINGEAVEVGPDSVVSADAVNRAQVEIRRYITQHGPATVAQLKAALGSCRRIMVPLLERFDREGLTIRAGDLRSIRQTVSR